MNDKSKAVDPIPEEFASYEEAANFWDTHDTTDYLDSFETVPVADINFLADLRELIAQKLISLGHPPKLEEELDTILIRYLNFENRRLLTIQWSIEQSQELANRTFSKSISLGLQEFIKKAESGQDLNPHLSEKSNDPDFGDLMFYDWNIFHFHLGIHFDPKRIGFVKRTDELLFAIVDYNQARMYLIDIHPHKGGFTKQDLLRIIEENWPEILEPYTLKGIDELTDQVSDNDIYTSRKKGENNLLSTPSGRILIPIGEGLTSDKTSVRNLRAVDQIITNVHQLEKYFIQKQDEIAADFKNKYGKNWNELKFKVMSFETPVKIQELTTGKILNFT